MNARARARSAVVLLDAASPSPSPDLTNDTVCPTCGRTSVEPLYTMQVACEIIPLRMSQLHLIISRFPEQFPSRIHMGMGISGMRLLSLSEIVWIREYVIKTGRPSRMGWKKDLRRPVELREMRTRDLNVRIIS